MHSEATESAWPQRESWGRIRATVATKDLMLFLQYLVSNKAVTHYHQKIKKKKNSMFSIASCFNKKFEVIKKICEFLILKYLLLMIITSQL